MKEKFNFKEMDKKELDFPDTVFARDIESRVFQAIAVRCLSNVKDVSLIEGNLLDNFLGREGHEKVKGIHVEQNQKSHSVGLKIELNVSYGVSLPEKAEEIQTKITNEICRLTGLHVSSIHIVFKNLISEPEVQEQAIEKQEEKVQLQDK